MPKAKSGVGRLLAANAWASVAGCELLACDKSSPIRTHRRQRCRAADPDDSAAGVAFSRTATIHAHGCIICGCQSCLQRSEKNDARS